MRDWLRRLLARKPWRPSAKLRLRADQLRRLGRLVEAEALYREYLADRPDDAVGWCMLAHCLSGMRRLAEADAIYAQAAAMAPDDPSAQLFRAGFLFLQGREADMVPFAIRARAAGASAARIAEVCGVFGLGQEPALDAQADAAALWIDLSDLLIYLGHNTNLSGIHRVITALVQAALEQPGRIGFVLTRPWSDAFWALAPSGVAGLLPLIEAGQGASPAMQALIDRLVRGARPAIPRAGLRYLQPGAFWLGEGSPPLHAALRRAGALEFVLMHDLIPLTHPHLCMADQVRLFNSVLGEVLLGAHGIIANSRHTANEVQAAIAAYGLPARPVAVTPLAHAIRPVAPGGEWPASIAALRGQDFVLSVGTIERRKNHALLVRVWGRLLAEGLRPPVLVLAGKPGWDYSELETALAETGGLDGLLRIMPGLSDAALETLYQNCLFTTAPSLIEGWGLPIGESMARGKLCVTSLRGSMPEVGEGHALLIDPEDADAAVPLFRRLITDPEWRQGLEAEMAARFAPRDWPEAARSIIAACLDMPLDPVAAAEPARPRLPAGLRLTPGPLLGVHARIWPTHPVAHPLRMILSEGWRPPVENGCQMAGPAAWLHLEAMEPGVLHVALAASRRVRITARERHIDIPADGHGMLRLPLAVGPHSICIEASMDGMPAGTLPWVRLVSLELRAC